MTALLETVGSMVNKDCLVKKGGLKKDGCKVAMTNAPAPKLVVDFDRAGSPLAANATRCDYLIVAEVENAPDWVAVLELKRGKLHAERVVKQLRAGASAAARLIPKGTAVRFRPIAASSSMSKYERLKLQDRASRIEFHGQNEPVRLMSCGAPLVKALR